MKTRIHIISLALVTTCFAQDKPERIKEKIPGITYGKELTKDEAIAEMVAVRPWNALEEAVHTEEVARDLDLAVSQYEDIYKRYKISEETFGGPWVASAVMRLAEIHRKKGRDDEAKKYYNVILSEFPDMQPAAHTAQERLGLNPSKYLPEIEQVQDEEWLNADKYNDDEADLKALQWRDLWKMRSFKTEDGIVLVTIEAGPEGDHPNEGLPRETKIQTLHYDPSGSVNGWLSYTCSEGDFTRVSRLGKKLREIRHIQIDAFGSSYTVPKGLVRSSKVDFAMSGWDGERPGGTDCAMIFSFVDDPYETSRKLKVSVKMESISPEKALSLAEERSMDLPATDGNGWILTLPPLASDLDEDDTGK